MDLVEIFYTDFVGHYPFPTEREKIISCHTIEYLRDCGFTDNQIIKVFQDTRDDCLYPDKLPEYLWTNSLVEQNTYYFHHSLHLMPPAPQFDIFARKIIAVFPFYIEIKINYTIKDLTNYFYSKALLHEDLRDAKKDQGSLEYLLKKYSRLKQVKALDFVLRLIDEAADKKDDFRISSTLQIANFDAAVLEHFTAIVPQAHLSRADRIIWRSEEWIHT